MYHQREKLQQICYIALFASVLSLIAGLLMPFPFFLYFTTFFLSIAMIAEGILLQFTHMRQASLRLLCAGLILCIVSICLLIRFLQGS